jgi:L-asparaginase/Glu-tRNA(Gln) amidotransferase subunit D
MLTFDPSLFILNNQDLFMTVGVVVAIGTFTLAATAVVIMLALRTMK